MSSTSPTESTAARLSRHLECPVCLDMYDKPKALPCQHTFCLSCIKRTAKGGNTIQCPSCKTFHRLPNDKAEDFPNNYTLMPMIEELQSIRVQEDASGGHQQDSSPNEAVDKQLQQDTLKDIESRADTLDIIVNRVQALQETVSSKSSQVKSVITADIGHLVRCLQERQQELLDDVALQTHTENSRLQTLKGEVAAEARHLRELCNRHRRAMYAANQVIADQEWRAMIQQGDQYLQRITQTCKRYEQVEYQTMEFLTESEQRKGTVEGLRHYGQLSIRQEVQHVLLQRTRLLSLPIMSDLQIEQPDGTNKNHSPSIQRTQQVPHNDDERNRSKSESRFPRRGRSLNASVLSTTASTFLDPSILERDNGNCAVSSRRSDSNEDNIPTRCQTWIRAAVTAHRQPSGRAAVQGRPARQIRESTKIIEGSEYDPLYPRGLTVLSTGKLAVASGGDLRIFSTDGVEETTRVPLKTRKARVLADVCTLSDGTILATDSFNNEVLQFSSTGRPRGAFHIQELGKKLAKTMKPYGITRDRNGFLYICDRENNGVVVCRPNGVIDKVIGASGENRLMDPLYLALHKNEMVMYVTDCKAAVVMVYTVEGDFIRRIPKPSDLRTGADEITASARFSRPAGISVALDGSLVVCDNDQQAVYILDQNTGDIIASIGDRLPSGLQDDEETVAKRDGGDESSLARPMGLICFERCIAVCDTENNRIQIYRL